MLETNCFPEICRAVVVWLAFAAADASAADEERDKWNARFDEDITRLTGQIEKSPKSVDLYSRRGDASFFRGKFAEAVADYEEMVELQPALETSHWRKGIAYFYAKRYKDAAMQFENA
jgi:lipoprotein NlpI